MRVTVRIEGMDKIERNVRAMARALDRETLIPIMEDRLQPMAGTMRAMAARRTGQMADSVTVGTELSPAQAAKAVPIAEYEVFVGPGPLPQAIAEEFGNSHESPRPFIRPAFDEHSERALREIGKDGIAVILNAAKKG